MLGHYAGVLHDGHEIGVPLPARDDMEMQVLLYARSRRLPHVQADVETLRVHALPHYPAALARQGHRLGKLGIRKVLNYLGVLVWDDHQMAVVVRVLVHYDEVLAPPV